MLKNSGTGGGQAPAETLENSKHDAVEFGRGTGSAVFFIFDEAMDAAGDCASP